MQSKHREACKIYVFNLMWESIQRDTGNIICEAPCAKFCSKNDTFSLLITILVN